MTQPSPPVTSTPAVIEYRPLSGWAVAGFLLGVLFTIAVIGSGLISMIRAEPFFLPGWVYVWALAAVACSLIGHWQIRNSEGTRAGAKLAKWGLWLSLLSGLGYFAYIRFTELALVQQANEFLMTKEPDQGFFPRLKDGSPVQVRYAYLLTKTPPARAQARPEDEQSLQRFDTPSKDGFPGELTSFQKSLLARAIQAGGEDSQIEPLGVKEWYWNKGGYRVVRNYRITTPEMILELVVPVQSMTLKAQRKWFVVMDELQIKSERFSDRGEKQVAIRYASLSQFPLYFNEKDAAAVQNLPITIAENRFNVDDESLSQIRESIRKMLYSKSQNEVRSLKPASKLVEPITKVDDKVQVKIPFSADVYPTKKTQFAVDGFLFLQSPEEKAMSRESWRPSRVELRWIYPMDPSEGSGPR